MAEPAVLDLETRAIDESLGRLQETKNEWVTLPLAQKISLARKLLRVTLETADQQVAAGLKAKGLAADAPLSGEEWLGGPLCTIRNLRLLIESLEQIARAGRPHLDPAMVRTRPDGQVVVRVLPTTGFDKLLYKGFSAEIWMQPEVTKETLTDTMATFYQNPPSEGKVALVLGAGNVASIGPLDVIYKLFVEGQVCFLKFHPVNEYLGPFMEKAFAPFIEAGYVQTTYGGADVGAYLCQHEQIDEIHITGSDKTHDAIVFGPGDEGQERKRNNTPLIHKRVTSELGNVSPVILVPGPWSEADLTFQSENIATQMTNNAGFNCNACKMIITHEGWAQRDAFLNALRDTLASVPQRKAYYPGAEVRYDRFIEAHPEAQPIGERREGVLPWTLIPGLDSSRSDDLCFREESFCGITGETRLPGEDAADFLRRAVAFCNDKLWGTLNASIVIHPKTAAELGDIVEDAIADLRYGTVGINHWAALGYGLGTTTWGGYPGHTYENIQSGIGVVHNTLMFDKPQKTIVRGPFRVSPKPAWFVTNKQTHKLAPRMVKFEASPGLMHLPGIFFHALRG